MKNYINKMLFNQNTSNNPNLNNLFSFEDYETLYKEVLIILNNNHGISFSSATDMLFNNANILSMIRSFLFDRDQASSFYLTTLFLALKKK